MRPWDFSHLWVIQVLHTLYKPDKLSYQVNTIPKKCAEDTTLTTTNAAGEKVVIPVAKGSGITLHTPGLHYNRESDFLLRK